MLSERVSTGIDKDYETTVIVHTKAFSLEKRVHEASMEACTSMDIGLTPSEEIVLREKNYEFSKMIGEGACGKVYLCYYKRKQNEQIPMACKIIHTAIAPKEIVGKFLPRELDILQKLNHPNIVHVFCIFQGGHGDKFLIFMRVAELGDLLDFILREGEIAESVMKVWFFQMAVAVEYLHTLEIAHRDLKCENILITERYNVKLADFGFSRFVVEQSGKQLMSTTYCGSLPYCAPEILKGKPYHPKPTDMWALGVVLFVGLNKSMPFPDLPVRRIVKLQVRRGYKFRSRVLPNLSQECIDMVTSLLEPEWKKRPTITDALRSKWFEINGEPIKLSEAEINALDEAKRIKKSLWPKKPVKGKKLVVAEEVNIKSLKRPSHTDALFVHAAAPSIVAVPGTNIRLENIRNWVTPNKKVAEESVVMSELQTEVKEFSAMLQLVNSKTAAPSTYSNIEIESQTSLSEKKDIGIQSEQPTKKEQENDEESQQRQTLIKEA